MPGSGDYSGEVREANVGMSGKARDIATVISSGEHAKEKEGGGCRKTGEGEGERKRAEGKGEGEGKE
jgi:hypothetical protein